MTNLLPQERQDIQTALDIVSRAITNNLRGATKSYASFLLTNISYFLMQALDAKSTALANRDIKGVQIDKGWED